jgi:isopentenyl-diphosphate Delta-isomerase
MASSPCYCFLTIPIMPDPSDPEHQQQTQTISRKQEHLDLCVQERVTFREKTSGLERFSFVHNALPELNFAEVQTHTLFLSKPLSMPFMVSCMTGGYADAERINRELAEVCADVGIAMGVGSQRQALENTAFHESFRIARSVAPGIPLVANIGGPEVAKPELWDKFQRLVDMIEADALTIHLNPLQELMQPEGTPAFKGVLRGIEHLCASLDVPVIVKEVGAGLSGVVTQRLLNAGVAVVDVAGAGGTSWAGVELLRAQSDDPMYKYRSAFWDWGLPTADCLQHIRPLRENYLFTLVASGGITSGMEAATAIALGADMAASARPFMQTLIESGQDALRVMLLGWQYQLRSVMFLTGAASVQDLQRTTLVERA